MGAEENTPQPGLFEYSVRQTLCRSDNLLSQQKNFSLPRPELDTIHIIKSMQKRRILYHNHTSPLLTNLPPTDQGTSHLPVVGIVQNALSLQISGRILTALIEDHFSIVTADNNTLFHARPIKATATNNASS
jgi:hypothetical protein